MSSFSRSGCDVRERAVVAERNKSSASGAGRFAWALVMLCLVTGCVGVKENGSEQVFQYEWWFVLSMIAAGFAAMGIGWLIRNYSERYGWGLVILTPCAMLLFIPSIWRDRVVVTPDRFHVRTGIWGLTAVSEVDFSNLRQIRVKAEKSFSRRGIRTNYYLYCDKKVGGSTKVGINNAVTEAAAEAILIQADAHDIPIVDSTD